MKFRWAAALALLCGLHAGARASGFGFTLANATVTNTDTNGNGHADAGDSFTITGAHFASYTATGSAPSISDSDLGRYTTDITGSVTQVSGTQVRYAGTFRIVYTGDITTTVETGTLDLRAVYAADGTATLTGTLTANAGSDSSVPPFNTTDFSSFNPGRFFGAYRPIGNGSTGSLSASLNAGAIGFAAGISNATLTNADSNGNGHSDVGETFTLSAPLSSYVTVGGPPLSNPEIRNYTINLNGAVASITPPSGSTGALVNYTGTFSITYNNQQGFTATVETGTFTLAAQFNEAITGGAKLTGQFIAAPGPESASPPFNTTDFGIFNPGTFTGTYQQNGNGNTGSVSGSLVGGVLGFSASIATGTVTNTDTNENGRADVGEPFTATAPLSAYLSVGAPVLTDSDLTRYSVTLNGSVTAVNGGVTSYAGTFRITYTGPAVTTDIESGTFTLTADYTQTPLGVARVTASLTARAGAETNSPPFDQTDFSAFNPAVFHGTYASVGNGATGTLRGNLIGGATAQPIQSRKLGTAIEGSPTAATLINTGAGSPLDDARRAIVASGSTLFVIDPATGDDALGFAGGKPLSGTVVGRPAVLKDVAYVGTTTGSVYAFNLRTGAQIATNSVAGTSITGAPAAIDGAVTGEGGDRLILTGNTPLGATIVKLDASNLTGVSGTVIGGTTTSSASVPYFGSGGSLVFIGSSNGLHTLRYDNLTPQSNIAVSTPTAPLYAGDVVVAGVNDGSVLLAANPVTGAQIGSYNMGSPLVLSAFYELRTNLIQAGTADGRVFSFNRNGTFAGLTLAGLFNPANTGGSASAPAEANGLLYRGDNNNEILSGIPLNGDSQLAIQTVSAIGGALAATGQTPGADYILATSPDGYLHTITVR